MRKYGRRWDGLCCNSAYNVAAFDTSVSTIDLKVQNNGKGPVL
jgi:hypothetical protein